MLRLRLVLRLGLVLLVAGPFLVGCRSTYTEKVKNVHRAYYDGDPGEADRLLDVAWRKGLADRDLLLLERALVLQARGQHRRSANLLVAVDQGMETLDYSREPVASLADFLFSLTATDYRTTPGERLLINIENMINFLVLGDTERAAVEARRARILLLQDDAAASTFRGAAMPWALAGLCFEFARKPGDAEDAYRAAGVPGFASPPRAGEGTILLAVQDGKAPVRVEGSYTILINGQLHLLQMPVLVERSDRYSRAEVRLDGRDVDQPSTVLDVRANLMDRYERELPRIMAAAITQMIPRLLTAEAVRRELAGDSDHAGQESLAFIASYLTEIMLGALTPVDTRSWSLLPGRVRLLRANVPAGRHEVVVTLSGRGSRRIVRQVDVRAGHVTAVNIATCIEEGFDGLPELPHQDARHDPMVRRALLLVPNDLLLRFSRPDPFGREDSWSRRRSIMLREEGL